MFRKTALISVFLTLAAASIGYVLAADRPSGPESRKDEGKAAPAKERVKPAAEAPVSKPATGGAVVFVDPATGQVRQPSASEIGSLVPPAGPPTPAVPIQGPGGAVGLNLGPETQVYTVATIGPGGKLTMQCVTGDKAAAERVTGAKARDTGKSKSASDGK